MYDRNFGNKLELPLLNLNLILRKLFLKHKGINQANKNVNKINTPTDTQKYDEVKQPTKNSELSRLSVCKTNPISVELI